MAEEHKTKIVVEGDVSNAVSGFGKVTSALGSISKVASTVTRALGIFGLAVNGAQMLWEGLKKVHEWFNRAATAAAKMRWANEMERTAEATSTLVGYHERLAKLMQAENDALAKQKELRGMKQQRDDDAEDGKRAAERARKIYEAKTPEEAQRLQDQFDEEDERIAEKRRKRDNKNEIGYLEEEESIFTSKARGLRESNTKIDALLNDLEFKSGFKNMSDEDRAAIQKQIDDLRKQKAKNEENAAKYDSEAKFRRDKIAIIESQGNAPEQGEGYWKRKTEQKKRDEEAAKKQDEEWKKVERYDNLTKKFAAEDELEAKEKRLGALQEMAGNGSVGVSQNRLTAMGLGAGVSGPLGGISGDVHKMVDLLKAQIEATKKIQKQEARDEALGAIF